MFRNAKSNSTLRTAFSLALSLCGLCLLSACGGSGSIPALGGSPPPVGVSIALTGPAHAIDVGQSESLTATVKNDPADGVVNWTIGCLPDGAPCGSLSHALTASGAANAYTTPSAVSAAETVTLTATSASDRRVSASFQITVSPILSLVSPPPAQPPAVEVGQTFSLDLTTFVQGGAQPLAWRVVSGALPAGLTLNGATGMVTGTAPGSPGTSAVGFTATDASSTPMSVNVQISLTIIPVPPPVISPSSGTLPAGEVGFRYNRHCCYRYGFLIKATGGKQPYAWSWVAAPSSSLPPGLTLNPFGLIDGVPTTAGTYNFIVTVTDSQVPAAQASASYTITVIP